MDFLFLAFGALVLFLPGLFITNRLKMRAWEEWIPFSLLFSLLLFGMAVYSFSLFFPIPSFFFLLYLFFFFALFFHDVRKGNFSLALPPRPTLTWNTLPLLILSFYFVFLLTIVLRFPPIAFDSLSYHQSFIHWMQTAHQFPFFSSPQNILEFRANGFPKLYESIIGGLSILSSPLGNVVPVLIFAGLVFMVHSFLSRIRLTNPISLFLLAFYPGFFAQFVTDYVDAFTVLVFLGALYLLTAPQMNKRNLFFAGLLMGALFSIKITAVFLFPALLVGAFAYHSKSILTHTKHILLGLILGVFPLLYQWTISPPARYSLGLSPFTSPFPDLLSHSLSSLVSIPTILLSSPESSFFMGTTLITLLLGIFFRARVFYSKSERAKLLLAWSAAGLIVFILFFLLSLWGTFSLSFMRYVLPTYAVACILAGGSLTYFFMHHFHRFQKTILIILLLLLCIPGLTLAQKYYAQRDAGITNMDTMLHHLQQIPSDARVYFGNAPNPIIFGAHYSTVWDYSTIENMDISSCASLRDAGVTHVVLYYPTQTRDLGPHNESIRQDVQRGNCGRIFSTLDNWLVIYSFV